MQPRDSASKSSQLTASLYPRLDHLVHCPTNIQRTSGHLVLSRSLMRLATRSQCLVSFFLLLFASLSIFFLFSTSSFGRSPLPFSPSNFPPPSPYPGTSRSLPISRPFLTLALSLPLFLLFRPLYPPFPCYHPLHSSAPLPRIPSFITLAPPSPSLSPIPSHSPSRNNSDAHNHSARHYSGGHSGRSKNTRAPPSVSLICSSPSARPLVSLARRLRHASSAGGLLGRSRPPAPASHSRRHVLSPAIASYGGSRACTHAQAHGRIN